MQLRMIPRLGVRSGLCAIVGLASVIIAIQAALVLYQGHASMAQLATVYENQVLPAAALQSLASDLKEIRFRLAGVLLGQLPSAGSRNHLAEARQRLDEHWAFFKQRARMDRLSQDEAGFVAQIDTGMGMLPPFLTQVDIAYAKDDKAQIAPLLEDEWPLIHTKLVKPLERLDALQSGATKVVYEENVALSRRLATGSVVGAAVSLLLIMLGGYVLTRSITRSITRPLAIALRVAQGIAQGTLTEDITVTSTDEIGQLMQAMQSMSAKLRQIVGTIQDAVTRVSTAASEIVAGNSDLSQRTQAQSSALAETTSRMEEMTNIVEQNAANAHQAEQLAASARAQAEQGGTVVRHAVAAMAAISQSSRQIAEITSVIDSIAFQTNMLALNAAVEAARAGEQGRGFAVVAAEVRTLAQRSAEAAKEIKALIVASGEKVVGGTRLVDESGAVLAEIVTAVTQVSTIVAEIAAASQEQTVGIKQVNKTVMQMDEMTQHNAALVAEAAAASTAVETQAQHLRQLMEFFT